MAAREAFMISSKTASFKISRLSIGGLLVELWQTGGVRGAVSGRHRGVARPRKSWTLWHRNDVASLGLLVEHRIGHDLDAKLIDISQTSKLSSPAKDSHPIIAHCYLRRHHPDAAHDLLPEVGLSHSINGHRSVDGDHVEEAHYVLGLHHQEVHSSILREAANTTQLLLPVVELLRGLNELLRMRGESSRRDVFGHRLHAIDTEPGRCAHLGGGLTSTSGIQGAHNLIVHA